MLKIDGNSMQLCFPIAKVDEEKRTVSGVAIADNLDKQKDIVSHTASLEAFGNWVGNIREMHAPKAVGKSVGFYPSRVEHSGQIYNGISVEAYISKGAQDTWEKVLDGTLTGFSVGGRVLDADEEFDKSADSYIRRVNKYELGELSLVDNPANPAANITMIKMDDGGQLEYILSEYIEKATKREAGEDFPASAFAYVPDSDTPSTWKLRLWESVAKKETAAQVGRAVAALGKGFRGNKVQIPSGDLSSVKAKVRAAWKRTHSDDDELPAVLKGMDIYYCEEDGVANFGQSLCSICGNEMTKIGETEDFNIEVLKKFIDSYEGGDEKDMDEDLQKNENNSSMSNMNLTDEQKGGVLGAFTKTLFGNTTSTTSGSDTYYNFVFDKKQDESEDELSKNDEDKTAEDGGEGELDVEKFTDDLLSKIDAKIDEKLEVVTTKVKEDVDALSDKISKASDKEEESNDSEEEEDKELSKNDDNDDEDEVSKLREELAELKKAVKKSADVADEDDNDNDDDDNIKKSDGIWGNHFLDQEVIVGLGYDS